MNVLESLAIPSSAGALPMTIPLPRYESLFRWHMLETGKKKLRAVAARSEMTVHETGRERLLYCSHTATRKKCIPLTISVSNTTIILMR
jgi:hypothetical protein